MNERHIVCEKCGMRYPSPAEDQRHAEVCERFQAAAGHFGAKFVLTPQMEEEIRRTGLALAETHSAPLEDRVEGVLMVFRAWFSRSLAKNGYRLDHPAFEEYTAMLLHQPYQREMWAPQLVNLMIKHFGSKPGMGNGRSYWQPAKS